jgi:hypothetical protein
MRSGSLFNSTIKTFGTRPDRRCNLDLEGTEALVDSIEQSSAEGRTVFEADFPFPAEQAEDLLEICQGYVVEARRIADTNLELPKERRCAATGQSSVYY